MRLSRWTVGLVGLVSVAGCSAPIPAARPAVSRSASAIIAHQGPPVTGAPTRAAPSTAPTPTVTPRPAVTPHAGTLHYIANVGTDVSPVVALGYDLFDTGPDPETLAALPPGGRALVWLGSLDNSDCAAPDYTFAQFAAAVGRLAGNPRVYGYFLADEPHPAICPTAVADIRARADYIRAHDPSHRSFIVVLDGTNQCGGTYGCEFRALGPANTHVDLIGIDPYPCNVNDRTCTYRKIDDTAHRAVANGIPAADLVPVFQVFGQDCAQSHYYRQPTSAELRTMLAHWAAVLPRPAFDYTYTWGRQGSSCPTLIDAKDLQIVMRTHNSE